MHIHANIVEAENIKMKIHMHKDRFLWPPYNTNTYKSTSEIRTPLQLYGIPKGQEYTGSTITIYEYTHYILYSYWHTAIVELNECQCIYRYKGFLSFKQEERINIVTVPIVHTNTVQY